jgi:hypothetical protein
MEPPWGRSLANAFKDLRSANLESFLERFIFVLQHAPDQTAIEARDERVFDYVEDCTVQHELVPLGPSLSHFEEETLTSHFSKDGALAATSRTFGFLKGRSIHMPPYSMKRACFAGAFFPV